jgi:protein-L-isoaspartate(D-aspartate) O-methyltransferase
MSQATGHAMAGPDWTHHTSRRERIRMVEHDLAARGVTDARVLDAMAAVPREAFVRAPHEFLAYEDRPLPIGSGQTISQPLIVALMLQAAAPAAHEVLLDVGTGSGYAAAVASRLAAHVFSIERHAELAEEAADRLHRLNYHNVTVRIGDGTLGWPEAAPFDAIVVAAGAPEVPTPLIEQLAPGGRLVLPVGHRGGQRLFRYLQEFDGIVSCDDLGPVAFVPLIGAHGWSAGSE